MVAFIVVTSALLIAAVAWAVSPLTQGVLKGSAAAALIIAVAIALYWRYGTPEGLFSPPPATEQGDESIDHAALTQMIAGLQAKLEQSPRVLDDWLMLGRSYTVIGRFNEALRTYQRAHAVLGDQPDLLADWAEVELHARDNVFNSAITQRIEQALASRPLHAKSLWLGGFAALQSGNKALALERWQRLLAIQPAGSDTAHLITQLIAEISTAPNPLNTSAAESGANTVKPLKEKEDAVK